MITGGFGKDRLAPLRVRVIGVRVLFYTLRERKVVLPDKVPMEYFQR